MSKIKIAFIALILICSAVAAYVFIPVHTTLGKQVLSLPVGDNLTLVGFKSYSTERKLDKLNQYFLIANGSDVKQAEPFLTTSDQFLRIKTVKDNTLALTINGRIESFRNDLWIEKSDGTFEHWLISIEARYLK
ncbi:hypothetical protein [Vibrio intestinalis]|uniref:hypothetical protein n=1 Tax=Vibrio intestinalis TaxID=2933291 RepID=UPI0021A826C3|nr:hypothetical protein [Vibrio intestinalis]